jgi:hypothetical protein
MKFKSERCIGMPLVVSYDSRSSVKRLMSTTITIIVVTLSSLVVGLFAYLAYLTKGAPRRLECAAIHETT